MQIRLINKKILYIGLALVFLLILPWGGGGSKVEKDETELGGGEVIIDPNDYSGFGPTEEEALELIDEFESNKNDYPLWNKLPYEGRGYKISKYSKPLTVVVYPIGLDKEVVEREVRQWIKDNGGDEVRHQIEWR